jgi:cell division protein FtsI (penicillin-binding protein 3)
MNNGRTLVVIVFVLFFFSVLIYKLFDIQLIKHADYEYVAKNQQKRTEILRGERGFIYDRNGDLLVYDRNEVSFFIDAKNAPPALKDSTASRFARVFGKSVKYYQSLMSSGKRNVCLEKKASADKALLLKDYVRGPLKKVDDPTRIYSYDNLASHLLGYTNEDFKGIEGIEKYYDKFLAGRDGRMLVEKDERGRMITISDDSKIDPMPGNDITLTIDRQYQKILEEELKNGVQEYAGTSAVGIIMDPNNGEILAMANAPDFNPNCYWTYDNTVRRNRILTDSYEPGSTFKSITMGLMLDKHKVRTTDAVYCENGVWKYKNVNITDSHRSGTLTVRGVLEQSSNIGMAKLVLKLDQTSFYKYLRDAGFGNLSCIDLPGECRGRLKTPSTFDEHTMPFMSFGYEISVTPLQIISAYSALINGGTMYQPHLLKRITARNGQVVEEAKPVYLRKIISQKTSETLKNLLVGVVENGTAKAAQINNVLVGGKTGTAQQLIGNKYSKQNYNSSFVGFFPADNPRVICLILVNSPQKGRYGGSVAAPMFKDVAERMLSSNVALAAACKKEKMPQEIMDNVIASKSKHVTKVSDIAQKSSSPAPKITHYTNSKYMPDLKNYTLRDALRALTEMGLKYNVSGNGRVVSQSILPGQKISLGLVCTIKCELKKIK